MPSPPPVKPPVELSGRWVVVGMFAFAIAATSLLWVYWKLHIGPFLPLQQALAAEFEGSRPRVEGGQRKMHQQTPHILRITMRVPFDPTTDNAQAEELAGRVAAFTCREYDLDPYERLEVHFFWPEPEKEIKQRTIELAVAGLSPRSPHAPSAPATN